MSDPNASGSVSGYQEITVRVPRATLTLDAGGNIAGPDRIPFLACGHFCLDGSGDRCAEQIGHEGKHVTTTGKEWRRAEDWSPNARPVS